jgi:hypothetical protein
MRIGEIVETNSMGFVAESLELHRPPALGSLVKVEQEHGRRIYAVVSYGQTTGLEPGRRALRRSTEEVHDAAIYDEHPELRRTLRTVFDAIYVGWEDGDRLRQHLPPHPPPLHFSVHGCEAAEVERFSTGLYYLRLLLAATIELPVAHLVIAHVNETYRVRGLDSAWVSAAARELAALLKNDNPTLMSILYAIDPG